MAFSYQHIEVQGIERISKILEFSMQVYYGEHGKAFLKAQCSQDLTISEMTTSLEGCKINIVIVEEDKKIRLFSGIVQNCSYCCYAEYIEVSLHLLSGSYFLDQERKCRSFQDTTMTYQAVVKEILKETKGADAIFSCKEEKIQKPLIQYKETDWEFIKRLASYFKVSLIPEVSLGEPKFFIGIPKNRRTIDFPYYKYEVCISKNYYKMGGKQSGFRKTDFLSYKITSDKNYEIGDAANIKGQLFLICSKSVQLEKGELFFCYELAKEAFLSAKPIYNEKISGCVLIGTVLETSKESVKLHLEIDKTQDREKAFFYPCIPFTGNLFYCMPEVGAKAALYVSTRDEKSAKVVHCIWDSYNSNEEREDKEKRYFTAKREKQMKLFPECISFQKKDSSLQLEIEDNLGVQIKSNQTITLTAKENISLQGERITIYSPTQVTAVRSNISATTVFNICNQFDAIGKVGGLSGSDRRKYKELPENSEPKQEVDASKSIQAAIGAIPTGAGKQSIEGAAIGAIANCIYTKEN